LKAILGDLAFVERLHVSPFELDRLRAEYPLKLAIWSAKFDREEAQRMEQRRKWKRKFGKHGGRKR
jgi:hypothetical protein